MATLAAALRMVTVVAPSMETLVGTWKMMGEVRDVRTVVVVVVGIVRMVVEATTTDAAAEIERKLLVNKNTSDTFFCFDEILFCQFAHFPKTDRLTEESTRGCRTV